VMMITCESMSITQVMYLHLVLNYLYDCVNSRSGPYDDGRTAGHCGRLTQIDRGWRAFSGFTQICCAQHVSITKACN
jgi:hypothetical protein